MRARRRGLSRLQATKIADQSFGQFPIARRSTRPHPPEARRPSTMARMRRRSSAVSEPQASIRRARSAGIKSDFARAIPPLPVFPGNLRAGSIPASATVPAPRAGFESPLPWQARRGYQPRSPWRCRAGTVKLRPPDGDCRPSRVTIVLKPSPQRRLPAGAVVPGGACVGGGLIWVPWLLSPLFALAPIAGCALAGKVRQSALTFPAGQAAEPLAAPTVTFAAPQPSASPGGAGAVAPIVPAGG